MTSKLYEDTARRVQHVRQRIADAAQKAGRNASDITLVGVTKTQPVEAVRALLQTGVMDIGENRVQEMLEKQPKIADIEHKMHLIGHLQRNKAKFLPGNIEMLQSLDNAETMAALEKAYAAVGKTLKVLIEVNIGGEDSKSGVHPDALEVLADKVLASDTLQLKGLMAIPPICEADTVRRYFEQMHHLFIDIKAKKGDNVINVLSMGMSSDFEYAIMEGATMVRVGADLFGPRIYNK
jgi:pyridoxal phosphate enzyme (YggS family)